MAMRAHRVQFEVRRSLRRGIQISLHLRVNPDLMILKVGENGIHQAKASQIHTTAILMDSELHLNPIRNGHEPAGFAAAVIRYRLPELCRIGGFRAPACQTQGGGGIRRCARLAIPGAGGSQPASPRAQGRCDERLAGAPDSRGQLRPRGSHGSRNAQFWSVVQVRDRLCAAGAASMEHEPLAPCAPASVTSQNSILFHHCLAKSVREKDPGVDRPHVAIDSNVSISCLENPVSAANLGRGHLYCILTLADLALCDLESTAAVKVALSLLFTHSKCTVNGVLKVLLVHSIYRLSLETVGRKLDTLFLCEETVFLLGSGACGC